MENPCINHLNCWGDMERSSWELRGYEKRPHSTRLYRSKYPSPSQRSPLIFVADLPQKRNKVLGTKRFALYLRSIMAAKESMPKRKSVEYSRAVTPQGHGGWNTQSV